MLRALAHLYYGRRGALDKIELVRRLIFANFLCWTLPSIHIKWFFYQISFIENDSFSSIRLWRIFVDLLQNKCQFLYLKQCEKKTGLIWPDFNVGILWLKIRTKLLKTNKLIKQKRTNEWHVNGVLNSFFSPFRATFASSFVCVFQPNIYVKMSPKPIGNIKKCMFQWNQASKYVVQQKCHNRCNESLYSFAPSVAIFVYVNGIHILHIYIYEIDIQGCPNISYHSLDVPVEEPNCKCEGTSNYLFYHYTDETTKNWLLNNDNFIVNLMELRMINVRISDRILWIHLETIKKKRNRNTSWNVSSNRNDGNKKLWGWRRQYH